MEDDYALVPSSDEDPQAAAVAGVRQILVDHGVPVDDAAWLTDALVALGPDDSVKSPPSAIEMSLEHQIGRPFDGKPSRDAALIELLLWAVHGWQVISTVPDEGYDPPDETQRLRRLLPAWTDATRGIDFDAGVRFLSEVHVADRNRGLARRLAHLVAAGRLLRTRRVDPLRHVDLAKIRSRPLFAEFPDDDPSTLTYWLSLSAVRTLTRLPEALAAEPIDSLGILAQGIHRRLAHWLNDERRPVPQARRRRRCYAALLPSFEVLDGRLKERPDDLALANAYWLYASCVHEAGRLNAEAKKRVLDSIRNALAQLRTRLRSACKGDAAARVAFTADLPRYLGGAQVMAMLEPSIWPAMKLLLLALREVPEPCTGDDLRYWLEAPLDPPPAPWDLLAAGLTSLVHLYVRREQREDPDLDELREEFAEFCLHRIETREKPKDRGNRQVTDEDMIEPSQVWRHCYVLAARELRVSPRRQGHRRLDWLAKNDPSPKVRKEAATAAKELRHGPKLPEGSSPRRAIMAALWQLRQAQFLAPRGELRPGVVIHPVNARRTRQKEVQRTREVEDTEE